MTRADSSLRLLGRSRDTGSLGVAAPFPVQSTELPLISPGQRVILRVWGFTAEDVRWAEETARIKARRQRYEIAEVLTSLGGRSPIPSRDPGALLQGADFDRTWAAYPAAA